MSNDARPPMNGTASSASSSGPPRPGRRFARVQPQRGEDRSGNLFDPSETDATVRHLRRAR